MSERLPKLKKLAMGGDYYGWQSDLQTYFESVDLWDHVSTNSEIEEVEDRRESP